jgi:hypothetical protein
VHTGNHHSNAPRETLTAVDTELALRARLGQEELSEKLKELARLQAELVDRELFLTNLRYEIHALEIRYMREVGALYLELDEWNAKITKIHTDELYIDSAKIQQELSELLGGEGAHSASSESRPRGWFRSRKQDWSSAVEDEPSAADESHPSTDLKAAYREVAKRVHPDFAVNEGDRQKRESLMKEANSAYQRGDLEALRRILEEYGNSPQSISGTDGATDLERIARQIAQIRRRLERIEQEIVALLASDIGNLKQRADAAWARGRDLLAEMAHGVRNRIEAARQRFYSGSE